MDTLLLLILMGVASLGSSAVVLAMGRVLGAATLTAPVASLVLGLPVAAVCFVEWRTGLWRHTPGSLGLGSLNVAMPMCLAGIAIAIAALVMRTRVLPFDRTLPRDSATLTPWLVFAVLATVLTLALWRYWPAPRPRLF